MAGGPFLTLSGLPVIWNDSQPIEYYIDPGDLGPFSHDEAAKMVRESFDAWQNAGYTKIRFIDAGLLPEDVTRSNARTFTSPNYGKNTVIFDHDGTITEQFYGLGSKRDVLGFSAPSVTGFGITEFNFAYIVINGYYLANVDSNRGSAISTIIHELGHFIGIDHCQIHRHMAFDGVKDNNTLVPIMFPYATDDDSDRTFLTNDDKAAVNYFYPNNFFKARTGSITGIVKRGSTELTGVNVVARRIDNATLEEDYFSTVTGYYLPGTGEFEMYGLPPGQYELFIEPIDSFFTSGSSVGPYARTGSDLSFKNAPVSSFYYAPGEPPSRSSATQIRVGVDSTTPADVLVRARSEEVDYTIENDTQLLAINRAEIGAAPVNDLADFQFLLEPTGNEDTVTITVQSDNPTQAFELLLSEEARVTDTTRVATRSIRGQAQFVLSKTSLIPLKKQRIFIAVRNVSNAGMTYKILAHNENGVASLSPTNTPSNTSTATSTATFTATRTPRPTLTPTPTRIPTRPPSESPTLTPTSPVTLPTTEGTARTETPTRSTNTPLPTNTPTPTVRIIPPSPTPTAREVNPLLGLVSMDEIATVNPSGMAVYNFDAGSTTLLGQFIPGRYDGIPDQNAKPGILFINNTIYPYARDMEFSGEIALDGNGSEGIYYLNGGMIPDVFIPPVTVKLGATGGPNRGGIDTDNNNINNTNFGTFSSDFIPNISANSLPITLEEFYPLVDLEPAGNGGFYVLARNGKIYAEGSANEEIDLLTPPPSFLSGSMAADMVIYRGTEIVLGNSIYSTNLRGSGAYILDQQGVVYPVGNVPKLNTSNIPVIPNVRSFAYQDIELIPDPNGQEWIGLGILNGNGVIQFIPFENTALTTVLEQYIRSLNPFGSLQQVFGFNIARGFEVEISDDPIYGLDRLGRTTATRGRRIGIFMFDGFGSVHTGGRSTRFTIDPTSSDGDTRIINGIRSKVITIPFPFTGIDSIRDMELPPPINTAIRNQ
jgi:hypothetical protein